MSANPPPYEVPSWAAKPPSGMHLDVMKDGKLVQKLMVDEKKCYLFGRNPQMTDFQIDHASCSRVHAAFVYHKGLERVFLVDLGSTHGTFIGSLKLEGNKPTQLPIDATFHFGASTRMYILREKPAPFGSRTVMEELERAAADGEDGGLLGLPETDTELDNLTEFNTAHNRRISMLGIPEETPRKAPKRKPKQISFREEEEIINPEDVDPNVGKFRNLVQSTVVRDHKQRSRSGKNRSGLVPQNVSPAKHFVPKQSSLYDDLPPDINFYTLSSKLDLPLPNPAPDIEPNINETPHFPTVVASPFNPALPNAMEVDDQPQKKKYAKEAWPGKKSGGGNLLL